MKQGSLSDKHPRYAGDGQHLGLTPLLLLRVPAVVDQHVLVMGPLRARQTRLYPNLVQKRKQNLPQDGSPRGHGQKRSVRRDRGEERLTRGLAGGGAGIEAKIAQAREETHPQLVKHRHLLVAGQVGQDLGLGDDGRLQVVLVLVEVVRQVPQQSHCRQGNVQILGLGPKLGGGVDRQGEAVVGGQGEEVSQHQLESLQLKFCQPSFSIYHLSLLECYY